MPLLEAPSNLNESSPDVSINQEVPAAEQAQVAILPVAAAQIHLPTPQEPLIQIRAPAVQQNQRNRERNSQVQGSYDLDIIEAEEENHFPAYVHLLPVVLPTQQAPEPTLEELLRRVTTGSDLQNLESVRLRVISYTLSLSHLAMFLPRLQHLDLSGSVLCSLRDLGFGLIHLHHLNVSNCGLNSFDGTSGFPALRILLANDNMIQRINPLTDLTLLQHLSVRNNRISELNMLTFLAMCVNLIELNLQGNPVCHQNFYRETLQRNIASLQVLDGVALENEAASLDMTATSLSSLDSDNISSLSSASSSMKSNELSVDKRPTAAATVNCDSHAASLSGQRSVSLSLSPPVIGSVVAIARQRQHRKRHMATAWASSDSSSYSTASSNHSTRPPSSNSLNDSCNNISATEAIEKQ